MHTLTNCNLTLAVIYFGAHAIVLIDALHFHLGMRAEADID